MTESSTASSGAGPSGELVRVGVPERLDPREHALVVARAGLGVQLALRLALDADPRLAAATARPCSARSVAQSSSTSRGPRSASRTGRRP